MSIVSSSDHWMFISSNGALTAGRRNPEGALFPYYTDDKIHDSVDVTGSKTILIVRSRGKAFLWEPFSPRYEGVYDVRRNLYKSVYGNSLRFEETNLDLAVTFSYAWCNSERFGFVKRSILRNDGQEPISIRILDGIQNLLPAGTDRMLQAERSTLLDAYKKSELLPDTRLGLFVLSSIPVDRAEPSEALSATTVWSTGLSSPRCLLSARQLDRFRRGEAVEQEIDVRAERGAYFVLDEVSLREEDETDWWIVAEVNQGPLEVASLNNFLGASARPGTEVLEDVTLGTRRLRALVAAADGMQSTQDELTTTRHYSNVLFNVMRGGIFDHHYAIERDDLTEFIADWNRSVAERHGDLLRGLPSAMSVDSLKEGARATGDAQLLRLCYEYLPLTFSRRHGDPSRPWNYFSIDTRSRDGGRLLSYQGNWRDIFQNWEALCHSYPEFVESTICKFVNASTPDGYNPYRISRDGIDWETVDPSDPWSYIGYWGDHQIVYLLKLLEISRDYHPGRLEEFLTSDLFAYADVPYRIRPYEDLLRDPHNTIEFGADLHGEIAERVTRVGADGRLVRDQDGHVLQVNLTEKLLVSVLAKLSNFVPGAGIWMNTQRPEWNDANNALVGYGASMVTTCYLRRFLKFVVELYGARGEGTADVEERVAVLLNEISAALDRHRPMLEREVTDADRKTFLDDVGAAASRYRQDIYRNGFSGRRVAVELPELRRFFLQALEFVEQTIAGSRRADGLYHSYNLIALDNDGAISIRHLYEMLEGQVAVLSSGMLPAQESLGVLDALRASALYRDDQHSYLLYPDRELPRYVDKNNIPSDRVAESPLLRDLIEAGDRRLVVRDVEGKYHFAGRFRNKADVGAALDQLSDDGFAEDVERDRDRILTLFDEMFDHQSYTGRSGTFFGYEGLGSIYWHMVSKLLLAVEETFYRAVDAGANDSILSRLTAHYYEIRAGIGSHKSPLEYGAFPMDPYSHTPGNAGAQQPGMTGQVKEDIIARWGELGVKVSEGRIVFRPALLRKEEFLAQPSSFAYYDVGGTERMLDLPAGTLAFTYCQVPIVYRMVAEPGIRVVLAGGEVVEVEGLELDAGLSAKLFGRSGEVDHIEVSFALS